MLLRTLSQQDKFKRILSKTIAALVILTPLLFVPVGYENFETPKVVFFILAVLCILVGMLSAYGVAQLSHYLVNFIIFPAVTVFVCYLGVMMITSVIGLDFFHSLVGSYSRKDGILLYIALVVFMFEVFVSIRDDRMFKAILLKSITLGCVSVAAISILQFVFTKLGVIPTEDLLYDGRVVATLGQPNFLGGYLVSCLPIIYYLNSKSVYRYVALGLCFLALVFSFSRSSVLALLIAPFGIMFVRAPRKVKVLLLISLVSLILLLFSVFNANRVFDDQYSPLESPYLYQIQRFAVLFTHPYQLVNSQRTDIIIYALRSLQNRFVMGYGKGNIDAAFYFQIKDDPNFFGYIVDSSHNVFLDAFIESGVFGFIALLLFFDYLINSLVKAPSLEYFLLVVSIIFVWGLFNMFSITTLILLAVITACSASESYS